MAVDALADIVGGVLQLFDIVGGDRPRSWRFLSSAWAAVMVLAMAFWHWQAVVLAAIGNWTVLGAIVWLLFALYLIGATIESILIARRGVTSRPAHQRGAAAGLER